MKKILKLTPHQEMQIQVLVSGRLPLIKLPMISQSPVHHCWCGFGEKSSQGAATAGGRSGAPQPQPDYCGSSLQETNVNRCLPFPLMSINTDCASLDPAHPGNSLLAYFRYSCTSVK